MKNVFRQKQKNSFAFAKNKKLTASFSNFKKSSKNFSRWLILYLAHK
jgi:hypothetical protein